MNSDTAAASLLRGVRERPWGLAAAAIFGGQSTVSTDDGADALTAASSFDWGSITKTITGVLLGYAIVTDEVHAEDRLAELLDVSGPAGEITLHELATQRSGLPRLPPNLDLATANPQDPYAGYLVGDLRTGLSQVQVGEKGYSYSNFGFMALGAALSAAAGMTYADLLQQRLCQPLGMTGTGCPPGADSRVPGYAGLDEVPWWSTPLPGAGGVGGPIGDLLRYLHASLTPPDGPLGDAIELATALHVDGSNAIGYGWVHEGGGLWHNGGTRGFRAFAALHRPSGAAVALLANSGQATLIDQVGFGILTQMAVGAG